jgi:hypothetical protein
VSKRGRLCEKERDRFDRGGSQLGLDRHVEAAVA